VTNQPPNQPPQQPPYPPYPPGQYPPGQYQGDQYPQGQYQGGQYPPGYYPPQAQVYVHAPLPKKGMSAGKVVLIILGSVGMLMFGTCATCSMLFATGAKKVQEAQDAEVAKAKTCDAAPVRSWKDIAAQMKKNEMSIVSSWKGNCQKVSGVVNSINAGFDDKPKVNIDSGGQLEFDSLHCEPADAIKAGGLTKGQTITVWGLGGNEVAGSLFLEGCDW
jgi:hypothetical protein